MFRRKRSKNKERISNLSMEQMNTIEVAKATRDKKKKKLEQMKQELQTEDHKITTEALRVKYRTDLVNGLSSELAARLLVRYGRNLLEVAKPTPLILVFLRFMFGGFALILWVALVLSMTGFVINIYRFPDTHFDELYLSIVIFIILIGTGLFGFSQEYQNHKIMDSFGKMVPKTSTVIRGGGIFIIPVAEIVPGDLVKLDAGDTVPADIRIIESHGLKVDNSSITGESEPVSRSVNCTDENPLETANLAFFSTNVIEGSGKGIVIATGQATLIGHIATLTSGLKAGMTPMKREVYSFIKFITIYAVVVSVFFYIIGVVMTGDYFGMFIYFIGIMVANIPEALLVTITACLTLMARKMTSINCMVRNMQAVETLGSTNVICSDKTGTLTQNRMTVSHLYYDHVIYDVLSTAYINGTSNNYLYLCRCAILCSRATFKERQGNLPVMQRQVYGDASETAVLKCMELLTRNTKKTRREFPKIFEIPFNSTNKYQLSIHTRPADRQLLLVMKGAPERVLDRCTTMMMEEDEVPIVEQEHKRISNALLELAFMGERVLAFADCKLSSNYDVHYPFSGEEMNFPIDGMRFVGFMSMIDPPRPGVPDAVDRCRKAGIRVVMVTGDHPVTAMAISRKVGIISPENDTVHDIAKRRKIPVEQVSANEAATCAAAVISGNELRGMDEDQLRALVVRYSELTFARTSPQQKLQIVEAFQKNGNIVAVTGDGVNDSPALKKADIGVAMGISGSDVSKDAADLVLLDDNFSSIVAGIEEGRLIFDNLKKSIAYMLTSNIPEVVPFVLSVILSTPKIISIMAVLIIDVGTDLWPGISLAYEPPESDIMSRPPRDPKEDNLVGSKLILFCYLNIGTMQTLGGLSTWFYTMGMYGFTPNRLMFIGKEWNSQANDVKDSYGNEWTYNDRQTLERMGVSSYFLGLVFTQIADCIISKTRRLSIAQHGFANTTMVKSLIFECSVAVFVVYCPVLNAMLGFESVHVKFLLPAFPFVCFIFAYDELRKYIIRKNPDGWFYRNTYY